MKPQGKSAQSNQYVVQYTYLYLYISTVFSYLAKQSVPHRRLLHVGENHVKPKFTATYYQK